MYLLAGKPFQRRAVWARPLESPKHWFWEDLRFQSKAHPQTISNPHTFRSSCTNASPGHGSRWTPCPSRWEDTSGGCMELLPCLGCSQWSNLDGLKTNKNDIIFSDGQWEGRQVGAVVISWCVLSSSFDKRQAISCVSMRYPSICSQLELCAFGTHPVPTSQKTLQHSNPATCNESLRWNGIATLHLCTDGRTVWASFSAPASSSWMWSLLHPNAAPWRKANKARPRQ